MSSFPVLSVVLRRLLLTIPLLFVVSALTFVIVSLIPGDPAVQILGANARPDDYERLRQQLGLHLPLWEQYGRWLGNALTGDLGDSLLSGQPVTKTIGQRLPISLSLVFLSLIVISVVGVGMGVFSAVRGGVTGRVVDAISLLGFALPGFWVGAVLIAIFAVGLRMFPAIGYVAFDESPIGWARSLVLPVVALAMHSVAIIAKQTREAMLDVLGSEHIRMARANGIPNRVIYGRLAFKNASMRIVTVIGIQLVGLLLGTLFVEQVFALPGIGNALVSSALNGDIPVVQGITVFITLIIVAINLVIDLAYTALDPRVRTS